MQIVILDDYADCVRTLAAFEKARGHEVRIHTLAPRDRDDLAARMRDAEAVILIRERTRIDADLLDRLPRLRLIAQTGKVGPHLDRAACERRGVVVTESAGGGAGTAELTVLLALASLRHLVDEATNLKAGGWQRTLGRTLRGRRFGIYGYGRIGVQVARLVSAFGAEVLAWGRETTLARARADGVTCAASREEFFGACDLVSLHLRLTPETRGIVTGEDFARMRRDAIFLNTSRAELVAPGALEAALRKGRPGRAAVDVFEREPVLGASDPLLQLPHCLATPHLGFVERDTYEAYFSAAFDQINEFAARA